MSEIDHSQHLQELESFFSNPTICRDSFRLLIHFAIRLAGVGLTHEVLAIVERSPDVVLFQPLVHGLRLHLGIPLQTNGPTRKLALQIASKIADEVAAHREARPIAC
jgi:hypothetical protein